MTSGNSTTNTNTGNYNYSTPNYNVNSVNAVNIPGTNQNAGGYQMPNISQVASQQNQNSQNFNSAENNQVGAFTDAYNAAAQALPTYQALNQANNAQYNVQPLMQNATNLNNQVLRLPSENNQLLQGSDSNQAQLDQMNNVQLSRLEPLAQNATSQAQQAQTLSNQATGYGVQNEAQLLSPYANTVPLQSGLLSGAYGSFTQQQSDALTALTTLAQSGATLSADQLNQLSSLQQAQIQANAQMQAAQTTATASQNAATISANTLQNVKAGTVEYNPATGQYSTVA